MITNLFSLKGKVALVTGALGLIGKKHCQALNEAGAFVVATDMDEKLCIEFAGDQLNYSMGLHMDVTRKSSVENALKHVLVNYRKIDILINNAAINDMFEDPKAASEESKFENYPLELWQRSLNVNLTGVFLCSQVIGHHMAQRKKGSIINIGSTYGLTAPDQRLYLDSEGNQSFYKPPAYPVTKAGVSMLTKYMAAYWGNAGVRVNTLVPGGVRNGQDHHFVQSYSNKPPLGRMATPEDYMGALVFLASDASSYMTGTDLVVDGGWTCW